LRKDELLNGALSFIESVATWLDSHANGMTALATGVIAAFTFTLWLSTHRLWKAEERQFAATNRPKLKVRYIKLALRNSGSFIEYLIVNVGVSSAMIKSHTITILHKKSDRKVHQVECFALVGGEQKTVEFNLANSFDDTFDVLTLRLRGRIEYEDGIGTRRRTGFAGAYDNNLDLFRRSQDPEEEYED
jgi:hypothetical protein